MNSTPNPISRGPYDLDDGELAAARQEAADFAATIPPWRIPEVHGTYHQKRPGLGVVIEGYDVDCSVTPHRVLVRASMHAWRTTVQ